MLQGKVSPYPLLSFREIECLSNMIQNALGLTHSNPLSNAQASCRVEKVFVPERPHHPKQFQKNEWVIDLYCPHLGEKQQQLFFSLHSQRCGFWIQPGRHLRPSRIAPNPVFGISLSKSLVGTSLTSFRAVPQERAIELTFDSNFKLTLLFIPAQPEGCLETNGQLLANSRNKNSFTLPEPRTFTDADLKKIPLREAWFTSPSYYRELWKQSEFDHIRQIRVQRIHQILQTQIQSIKRKLHSFQVQLQKSKSEPDWNRFGLLLQSHFYTQPKPENGFFQLEDFETGKTIQVPSHDGLTLKAQLEKYFVLSRRNQARALEATERSTHLQKQLDLLESMATELHQPEVDFEKLEADLGLTPDSKIKRVSKDQKKLSQFSGRQVQSKDGFTILIGKNQKENQEITFKIARGNDIWLHVKGRPSAHCVILVPPKKTAPLETLLDAAHLCIVHSGGKNWGKTDVDYTFRKHVKKIKNQKEVSYTQNKTLTITLDEARLKRLESSG